MTVAYPPNTALGRFGIAPLVDSPDPFVSSMPLAGLINPVTGVPTVGPLAVLVDHAAGLVNHYRREADEWTVSSELTLEITPSALTVIAENPEVAVVATARPVGTRGSNALGMCEITLGDEVIGTGTVRSVYVGHPGEFPQEWPPPVDGPRPTELTEIMALHVDYARRSAGDTSAREFGAQQQSWHRARWSLRRRSRAGGLGRTQRRPRRRAVAYRVAARELSAPVSERK